MDNPYLSLAFYHYLCDVIGTEDVVNMRRHIFTTIDNVNSDKDSTFISSGSKAEGLDLDGSDVDMMYIFNSRPVYENNDTARQLSGTYPFVMDTSNCKLGFTQLKQYKSYVDPCCVEKAGVGFLSSTTIRDLCKKPNAITHGPCNTIQGYIDIDYAPCLRCSTWISQAKPWIARSQHIIASNGVINAMLNVGVLFVPVGCKNSHYRDLEWRISFSYAEKLLIWSFNHVQLLCYALLKILLKDIIKQTTDDLLCSYFLKTIMLWICEETKSSEWKANNILSCFMNCFNRLVYCVQHKTCAHYFIPENDLFAERFDKQQHSILLFTLNQLQCLGWKCLLQTQTLAPFRDILRTVTSSITQTVSYCPTLCWFDIPKTSEFIQRMNQIVYVCLRANTKDFYIYMLSILNRDKSHILLIEARRWSGNKLSYNIYRKRLCHLLIGLNHDVVSGWLLLASHFYVNKQYTICKKMLAYSLIKCLPDTIVMTINLSIKEQTRFNYMSKMTNSRPLNMTRHHIIHHVRFNPSSQILPKEVDVLNDGEVIQISPVVFSIFLKFLCNHHLRNQSGQDESLQELEFVVQNKYLIINGEQLENAHMLLSIAYSMSGN